MKKKIYSILSCVFYVIAVFQFADNGVTPYAIICMGLGTIMLALQAKMKGEDDGSNKDR